MDTRELIEKYHNAWTAGDFATARGCLADSLDFKGAIDTFNTADDFIAALRGFQAMLKDVRVLQGCFNHSGAALLYDCDTATPAGVIRTAEFFAVSSGKISAIRLVFDPTELRKLMGPR
jgi:hypothetical protein